MKNREPSAIAMSHRVLDDLLGTGAASLLSDLFHIHGRRTFRPSIDDVSYLSCWTERGSRQRFALAISTLHVKGYIRWLPGDRYRIVSRDIMTDIEYEEAYTGATWDGGISRRSQGTSKGCRP
jgi:hypothetical protein